MVAARDVFAYIADRKPDVDRLQLCKLAYYAQAWHSVWEGVPLFADRIEAWQHGPVPVAAYQNCRYGETVSAEPLPEAAREVVDAVLDFYGNQDGLALRALTHQEAPWREARGDLPEDARSNAEISVSSMRRFYTKKSIRGEAPPRLTATESKFSEERTLALADEEMERWRETLEWLADR